MMDKDKFKELSDEIYKIEGNSDWELASWMGHETEFKKVLWREGEHLTIAGICKVLMLLEESQGWTKKDYPINFIWRAFTFPWQASLDCCDRNRALYKLIRMDGGSEVKTGRFTIKKFINPGDVPVYLN